MKFTVIWLIAAALYVAKYEQVNAITKVVHEEVAQVVRNARAR